MLARYQVILWCFGLDATPCLAARAARKAHATTTLTTQPTGPRQGDNGSRYFQPRRGEEREVCELRRARLRAAEAPGPGGRGQVHAPAAGPEPRAILEGREVKFFLAEPADGETDRLAGL